MKINEAVKNCCAKTQQAVIQAATWMGKTVSTVGHHLSDSAKKVGTYVRPYFSAIKDFSVEHKQFMFIGVGVAIAGLACGVVLDRLCCKGKQHSRGSQPV